MRRIIADTSVMISAFFAEQITLHGSRFDLSARARPIAAAIRRRSVLGLAPDVLFAEFLTTTAKFAFDRNAGPVLPAKDVQDLIFQFLSLPIARVPAKDINALAIDLVFSERVSPPDAWFVAAAIYADAELWYSHRHRDGIVEAAERLHPRRVFVLTENKFQI